MLKLVPPGARKGNKFYLLRGTVGGRTVEVSTKTADVAAARQVAEALARRMADAAAAHAKAEAAAQLAHGLAGRLAEEELHAVPAELVAALAVAADAIPSLGFVATRGIYFLLLGPTIQYVGQSHRVPSRVQRHREEKRVPFDSWRVLPCQVRDFDLLEAANILHHRPPYNAGVNRNRRRAQDGDDDQDA